MQCGVRQRVGRAEHAEIDVRRSAGRRRVQNSSVPGARSRSISSAQKRKCSSIASGISGSKRSPRHCQSVWRTGHGQMVGGKATPCLRAATIRRATGHPARRRTVARGRYRSTSYCTRLSPATSRMRRCPSAQRTRGPPRRSDRRACGTGPRIERAAGSAIAPRSRSTRVAHPRRHRIARDIPQYASVRRARSQYSSAARHVAIAQPPRALRTRLGRGAARPARPSAPGGRPRSSARDSAIQKSYRSANCIRRGSPEVKILPKNGPKSGYGPGMPQFG